MTAASDPYLRVAITHGEVQLLLGGEDPVTVENCDGFVALSDGETRSFTVLTLAAIERLMTKWQESGECLSGAHLRVPDLIILRSGGVDNIVAAVENLANELPIVTVLNGDG